MAASPGQSWAVGRRLSALDVVADDGQAVSRPRAAAPMRVSDVVMTFATGPGERPLVQHTGPLHEPSYEELCGRVTRAIAPRRLLGKVAFLCTNLAPPAEIVGHASMAEAWTRVLRRAARERRAAAASASSASAGSADEAGDESRGSVLSMELLVVDTGVAAVAPLFQISARPGGGGGGGGGGDEFEDELGEASGGDDDAIAEDQPAQPPGEAQGGEVEPDQAAAAEATGRDGADLRSPLRSSPRDRLGRVLGTSTVSADVMDKLISFEQLLLRENVDTSRWSGEGGRKTVETLYHERLRGRCSMVLNNQGALTRLLQVVRVRVFDETRERVITLPPKARTRLANKGDEALLPEEELPCRIMAAGEVPFNVAMGVLRQKVLADCAEESLLRLMQSRVTPLGWSETMVRTHTTVEYPGLPTMLCCCTFNVVVAGLPDNDRFRVTAEVRGVRRANELLWTRAHTLRQSDSFSPSGGADVEAPPAAADKQVASPVMPNPGESRRRVSLAGLATAGANVGVNGGVAAAVPAVAPAAPGAVAVAAAAEEADSLNPAPQQQQQQLQQPQQGPAPRRQVSRITELITRRRSLQTPALRALAAGATSVAALRALLTQQGVDVGSYGAGGALPVESLLRELALGQATLVEQPGGGLVRVVEMATVIIRSPIESKKVLVETHESVGGRVAVRFLMPSVKITAPEAPWEAAKRVFMLVHPGARSEGGRALGGFALQNAQLPEVEWRRPNNYPGIRSKYVFHRFEVSVDGLPIGGFSTKTLSTEHFWSWQSEANIEKVLGSLRLQLAFFMRVCGEEETAHNRAALERYLMLAAESNDVNTLHKLLGMWKDFTWQQQTDAFFAPLVNMMLHKQSSGSVSGRPGDGQQHRIRSDPLPGVEEPPAKPKPKSKPQREPDSTKTTPLPATAAPARPKLGRPQFRALWKATAQRAKLQARSDPLQVRDRSGSTALRLAALQGQRCRAAVAVLVKHRIDTLTAWVNDLDWFGCSTLYYVGLVNHTPLAEMLMARGASVYATCLHCMARRDCLETVRVVLPRIHSSAHTHNIPGNRLQALGQTCSLEGHPAPRAATDYYAHLFDFVCALDVCPRRAELLGAVLQRVDPTLPIYRRELLPMFLEEQINNQPHQGDSVGLMRFVCGSTLPLHAALSVVVALRRLAGSSRWHQATYQEHGDYVLRQCCALLDSCNDADRALAVLLERADPLNPKTSCFEIATHFKLKRLVAHKFFQAGHDTLWYGGTRGWRLGLSAGGRLLACVALTLQLVLLLPALALHELGVCGAWPADVLERSALSTPYVKSVMRTLLHATFIALQALTASENIGQGARDMSPTLQEWVLYGWVWAILLDKALLILRAGAARYWSTPINRTDTVMLVVFIAAQACHLLARLEDDEERMELGNAIFAVGALVSVFRMMHELSSHPTMGPLWVAAQSMTTDVLRFSSLLVVCIASFALALAFLRHGDGIGMTGFHSLSAAATSLLWEFFSPFTMVRLDSAGQFFLYLFFVFMLYAGILLNRLLIAMFTTSYAKVLETSDHEWKFFAALREREYRALNHVPPPLNVVTAPIALARELLLFVARGGRRGAAADDAPARALMDDEEVEELIAENFARKNQRMAVVHRFFG